MDENAAPGARPDCGGLYLLLVSRADEARGAPSTVKLSRASQPEPVLRGRWRKRLCSRNAWAGWWGVVSVQEERQEGAEVVEAVDARRVEQVAVGLDIEQPAAEPEEGVRDDVQYLGERERVHVQRTEQDAGDDNSHPGRRKVLDEPNEELTEEHLLHNRPHDPEHDDDDDWREHLNDFGNAGVILQGCSGQASEVEQGRGRQAADELDHQGGESAHDESEDGPPLTGRYLTGGPGQRVAEGDATDGEESDVEREAGCGAGVPRDEKVAEVEREEEGVDACEDDQSDGAQSVGSGACGRSRDRSGARSGVRRRRIRCSGGGRRLLGQGRAGGAHGRKCGAAGPRAASPRRLRRGAPLRPWFVRLRFGSLRLAERPEHMGGGCRGDGSLSNNRNNKGQLSSVLTSIFILCNSKKCVYQCDCILWRRELLLLLECFNSIG